VLESQLLVATPLVGVCDACSLLPPPFISLDTDEFDTASYLCLTVHLRPAPARLWRYQLPVLTFW
jgi:hypothetical protein